MIKSKCLDFITHRPLSWPSALGWRALLSEKDLRICKNRQKMAGGFRNEKGRQMYCDIMSFVETVKRKKLNISCATGFHGI